MIQKVLRAGRICEDAVRRALHVHDSQSNIESSAQKFWTRPPDQKNNFWWHWRNSPAYTDQQWLDIGTKHLRLYQELERMTENSQPLRKVVDWGCGGGANAVAFAPICDEFYGLDPSDHALEETHKQLESFSCSNFRRVKLDISKPEAALTVLPSDVDLFYCLYVFEVFPSQKYGGRILDIAKRMLRPGGSCFVQIKYTTNWTTQSRKWGYSRGVASMTSYAIDQFWTLGESVGMTPKAIHLVPLAPEVHDYRYAYYLFQNPIGKLQPSN